MRRALGILVVVALALLGGGSAQALTLEPVGDFAQPTYVTSDPGDAGRLFVTEREGTTALVENGVPTPFADISSRVGCAGDCEGERGLMSMALDPDFDVNGRLYVAYGSDIDGEIHVDELLSPGPTHATASFARSVLEIPHPIKANHNGGQLQFGPDGALYLSTGDGGGGNDQFQHAQDPANPLGKILRIDPDAAPPTSSVWSLGLRNPYRFSFDSLNGNMVIGDVGEGAREEIDFAPSPFPSIAGGEGANYGWNCREGLIAGPATDPPCATAPADAFIEPVFDYGHSPDPGLDVPRCAVTGGYVVRDPSLGNLYGHYVYADYCSGVVRSLQLPQVGQGLASDDCALGPVLDSPVSFGEDAAQRLYVVEQGGRVYRFAGLPPATCPTPLPLPRTDGDTGTRSGPTFVGIKAQRRRVERGKAALLTVYVSPCNGRRGQTVKLLRNGHSNGSRYLSRACTARFLRRIHRDTRFAAKIREGRGYMPATSRRLIIRLARRRHR